MSSEPRIVKAGYLIKSPPPEKLMAHWHRRYFMLWSSKLMEYYSSHEHRPQDYLKTINLHKCEDMVAPLPITNRPHVIKLSIRSEDTKLRDYYLDCTTKEEMSAWVKALAKVCGLSPDDEVGNGEGNYSMATDADADQPVYQDIEDSLEFPSKVKPKLRPPLPSSHLKPSFSQDNIDQTTYEEPVFTAAERNVEGNYHVLVASTGSLDEKNGSSEQWYDDMGINDSVVYSMNKYPPPIWRPGVERLEPPLPPPRAASSEPEDRRKKSQEVESPLLMRRRPGGGGVRVQRSPGHRPLPPPKPKGGSSSDDMAMSPHGRFSGPGGGGGGGGDVLLSPHKAGGGSGGDLFGLRNNPMFQRKLQEKRQELYGDTRTRSLSMGELAPECYDDVTFTMGEPDDGCEARPPKPCPRSDRPQLLAPHSSKSQTPSPRNSPRSTHNSPQHHQTTPHRRQKSMPTSPPPLPSRELIDPTMPPFNMSRQHTTNADAEEETPPPVPLRESSNRLPILPARTHERRNSLPSPHHSPIPPPASDRNRVDRTRECPLPVSPPRRKTSGGGEVGGPGPSFAQTLANVIASPNPRTGVTSPPIHRTHCAPLPPLPPPVGLTQDGYEDVEQPFSGLEEVYDDLVPTRSYSASDDVYDDHIAAPLHHTNSHNSVLAACISPPIPDRQRNPLVLPPRNGVGASISPPQQQQREVLPRRQHQRDSSSPWRQQREGSPGVGVAVKTPPLPPNKPSVSQKPKPLGPKPQVAVKPSIAKKPVVPSKKPVPPVAKKPTPPPAQAKPVHAGSPPGPTPLHSPPGRAHPIKPLPQPRSKPMVPKKPIPPLCS